MEDIGMKKVEVIPSPTIPVYSKEEVGFEDDLMKQNVSDSEFTDVNVDNKVESECSNVHLRRLKARLISISMPPSPNSHMQNTIKPAFGDDVELGWKNVSPTYPATIFHSQPIPTGIVLEETITSGRFQNLPIRNPRSDNLTDERYNSFKTWSGRIESALRGKPLSEPPVNTPRSEALPEDRYVDALEGPELDTLRPSEEIILPDDTKWPFLLRYPISSFGICLGVGSQAIMWKSLATTPSTHFLHISPKVNLILWCISILLFAVVATIYLLKIIFYFEAVRREYYHPIRVNFFFAPWIAILFLAIGIPTVDTKLPQALWYVLMTPIFILELKIYGQWMAGGQRRLSHVANPSNHLSVVGNFVGALLGASMGLKEGPIFFFAVGIAHYTVLFVTLYQRLPTNETLPKELHPVFFLFVAAPSVASMAWARINESFDYGARIAYFVAMFLYFSLAVRVNFFRGVRFSLAWWAYTFPMTGAAIATIRYMSVVSNIVTISLAVTLSAVATITVFGLLVTTFFRAFVMRDLFPNDVAIAISDRKPKTIVKWFHDFHRKSGSSQKHTHDCHRFVTADVKDMEVAVIPSTVKIVPDLDVESQTSLPSNV